MNTDLSPLQAHVANCLEPGSGKTCLLRLLAEAEIAKENSQVANWQLACQQCGPQIGTRHILSLLHNECAKTKEHCFIESEGISLFKMTDAEAETMLDFCFRCLHLTSCRA